MDEELRQTIETAKEQQPVSVDLEWYQGAIKLDEIKQFIRANINTVSRSFVAIGYYLKYIRDQKLYEEGGYSGILDLAKAEFGISAPQASKFMSINDKFSKDGNSPILQDKYKDFSSSKLSEMLYLSDEQLEQVAITTTRAEIRDIVNPDRLSHAKTESDSEKVIATLQQEQEPEKATPIPKSKIEIDFTKSIDALAAELEASTAYDCPPGQSDCRRNDWGPDGTYDRKKNGPSKDCLRCWKDWLTLERARTRIPESVSETIIPEQPEPKKLYYECAAYRMNQYSSGCTGCFYDKADCPYDRSRYLKKIREREERNLRYEVLKKMCDSICKSKAYILGKNNYSMETIRELSRGKIEFSFGFGDDGAGHSKYDAEYRAERYYVKELNGERKWIFEAGEVDQHVWNFNGRDWHQKVNSIPEIVDNQPEIVNDVDDDALPCDTCGHDVNGCCDYDDENNWCEMGSAWIPRETETEQVETVTAEIVETVPEDADPEKYSLSDVQAERKSHTDNLAILRKGNTTSPARYKTKMRLDAIILLDKEMCNPQNIVPDPEPEPTQQPELPILRNNDQRKEFIEAYTTWPVWIDLEQTGERYYRYDLTENAAIVVKVSKRHKWNGWQEAKEISYSAEQYYLLGIKAEYGLKGSKFTEDPFRTFYECNTNMTALIEYLKDFQKKGA